LVPLIIKHSEQKVSQMRNGTTVLEVETTPPQQNGAALPVKRYVDLKTAAALMEFSVSSLRRLIDGGHLPVIRIPSIKGRKPEQKKTDGTKDILRVDIRDIESFMRRHKEIS
jgi:hypothetical protein